MRLVAGLLVVSATTVTVIALIKLDTYGRRGGTIAGSFQDEIDELARIDPNLILYEESGEPFKTGFAASRAIAVDDRATVYVAGDNQVRLFSRTGTPSGAIEPAGAPSAVAVTPDGIAYIGVMDHIEIYDPNLKRTASWQSLGADAAITGIAVSEEGVFVADAGNGVVVHYDVEGKVVNHIGRKDPDRDIGGLVLPSGYFDLVAPKNGLLRVANPGRRRIETYTLDGDLEFFWGESSAAVEGFCGCCNPMNIAALPKGGFVTCEKGLTRVKIYSSDGVFTGVVAGPEQLTEPGAALVSELPNQSEVAWFDVAVDARGHVYILDTIKNRVRIFTRKKEG